MSVIAVRADGAELIYDTDDASGFPLGHISFNGKDSAIGYCDKWLKVGFWEDPVQKKQHAKSVYVIPPLAKAVDDDYNPLFKYTKTAHVALGRSLGIKAGEFITEKHQQGKHDQETHGNWAGERFGEDSVKSARDGGKEYAFKQGLKQNDAIEYDEIVANRARASEIADTYDDLPKFDKEAVDEYEALASEVEKQFDYMTKTLGVKVEFVSDDPYKTSKEMFAEVSTGKLRVLKTASTGSHPLFSNEQNDKFRAVHDYFGHAATGRGFGQDGEEAAWVSHSQMFTKKARGALTTETRGQNSWFNTRKNGFASQKVALLPEKYWEVPSVFVKHLAGQHNQETHGSWASGSEYKTGNWSSVPSETMVQQDIDEFAKNNPDATKAQLSALKSKSNKFYRNYDVLRNGDTVVTFQKRIDKNAIGVDPEERQRILDQLDYLQKEHPLENISILATPTFKNRVGLYGSAIKTKTGSAIEIHTFTIVMGEEVWANFGSSKTVNKFSTDAAPNKLEFTMAHEWGHAFNNQWDRQNPRQESFFSKFKNFYRDRPSLHSSMSTYGKKNYSEGFAEVFAQNAMENKLGIDKMLITTEFERFLSNV